jgi:hypothetical protein
MKLSLYPSLLTLLAASGNKLTSLSSSFKSQRLKFNLIINENLSVFDEDFEGSNDDDDVFDIDGVYSVFGNDTPEKGDSRYKPPGMALLVFPDK